VANHLKSSAAKARPKTILIADDDVDVRVLLRDILSGGPYRLIEVEDGQKALEVIRNEPVDLLITDRTMPHLDGIALLKILRNEGRQIPVLVISGYGDEGMWATAIGLGAEDYLLKPFTPESVMQVIQRKMA
jgi:CheY-like chemotaxis protein